MGQYNDCSVAECNDDRPCYVCLKRERDEALNRFEVLQDLSDQMSYSAGLSARRMEQAQQARHQAWKEVTIAREERDRSLAEVDRLRKVVQQVHSLVNGALEVTNSMWVTTKIDTALRDIQKITNQVVTP